MGAPAPTGQPHATWPTGTAARLVAVPPPRVGLGVTVGLGVGGLGQGGHWGMGQVGELERKRGGGVEGLHRHRQQSDGALTSRVQDQEAAAPTSPNRRGF